MILVLLSACTSPSSEECVATGATATLDLAPTFPTGLTWATKPGMEVYAPDGTQVANIDTATTLSLPDGPYFLLNRRGALDPAEAPVAAAEGLLDGAVQSICLNATSPLTVGGIWEEQPSSGQLWVSSGETLVGFGSLSSELSTTTRIDLPGTNDLRAFAFDAAGELWVATSPTYGTRLLVFSPGNLETPAVELAPSALAPSASIVDMEFDTQRNLWILLNNRDDGFIGLIGYTPAQAMAAVLGWEPDPTPAWSVQVEDLLGPNDMAFAPDGSLWIADFGNDASPLKQMDPSSFPESGTVAASKILLPTFDNGSVSGTLAGANNVVVTPNGGLWTNWWTSLAISYFSAEQLANGETDPGLLYSSEIVTSLPSGLARDAQGGLWWGDEPQDGRGLLYHLPDGAEAPDAPFSSADIPAPIDLAFDPAL